MVDVNVEVCRAGDVTVVVKVELTGVNEVIVLV